jgi:hypothetical protein
VTVRRRWLLAPLLIALIAGCADPYQQDTQPADSSDPATPARVDERPSRTKTGDTAQGFPTNWAQAPRASVDAFCSQWTNWNWRTIERQQRRLASLATGALARQLAAEAMLRALDRSLRRDRLGARGQVVAIDVKRGAKRRGAVCVAWEVPVTRGRVDLEGGRHRVYLATVAHRGAGWAVSRWEPQP